MGFNARTIERALAGIRTELLDAASLINDNPGDALDAAVPALDTVLRDCFNGLESCRRYLVLFRPPQYAPFDLTETLRAASSQRGEVILGADPSQTPIVHGDREQTLEALRAIQTNVDLQSHGQLATEIHLSNGQPRLRIRLTGNVALPQKFKIGDTFELPWNDMVEQWAAVTAGGTMTIDPEGIVLRFGGEQPPALPRDVTPSLASVRKAVTTLAAWRGATGLYDPGYASLDDIRRHYRNAADEAEALVAKAIADLPPV